MQGNLFSNLPDSLPDELVETLASTDTVRIERIVSQGHTSPPDYWYDQNEDEWVLVVQGRAVLTFETHKIELAAGDHVFIPAHARHRVEWTTPDEPTIWLAVFSQAAV